jgi:hypothetical protein
MQVIGGKEQHVRPLRRTHAENESEQDPENF